MTSDPDPLWARRPVARLARLGFADTDDVARVLTELGLPLDADDASDPDGVAVVDLLAGTANPNLALNTLARLAARCSHAGDLMSALRFHTGLRGRLLAVLGASSALGEHLAVHADDWQLLADDALATARPSAYGLRRRLLDAVGADPDQPLPWGTGGARAVDNSVETHEALRVAYRRQLMLLAARDLTDSVAVDDAAAELSDLAAAALEAGLAMAAAGLPAGLAPARLAVIAMGKCGGHELNYVSDVDVVFVGAPLDPNGDEAAAVQTCTWLAEELIRVCGQPGPSGVLFPVDAGLRPEGRAGPLVRTIASHRAYYRRWAHTWEFQALLKARPVAGDLQLGQAFVDDVAPLVWSASERERFVSEVQAMRRRVEASVAVKDADRQLKLGRGGLRDVEFAVQLLQLVHGRADPRVRSSTTLSALHDLREYGYVGRADGDQLAESYRWLRRVEHRLQLQRLRRTHTIPPEGPDRRWLARACGYVDVEAFDQARDAVSADVRRLHEKLFYRPLLEVVARLPSATVRMSPEQAQDRLQLLGFSDPDRAVEHLVALTKGVSRRAEIQRALLPVMLSWFAAGGDPDGGLLAFRQVSDALGETPWYLRFLRDEGMVAQRLAKLLADSRYASDLLTRAPAAMRLLADDEQLAPRTRDEVAEETGYAIERSASPEEAIAAIQAARRHELFRISAADVLGKLDIVAVGNALSEVSAATIDAALEVASRLVAQQTGQDLPFRVAVIALGRLGGRESSYGSDADVVFVHDPDPGADDDAVAELARRVAFETKRLLAQPGPDIPLTLDPGLRPEGRQGSLSRSLDAYRAYYARWSSVWEAHALLRAVPIAGDADLGQRFIRDVADPARYPVTFGPDQVREVRRLKARMESERVSLARRYRDIKLGPGGLSDVEWTVQLLQLRHAHDVRALRVTGTLPALAVATTEGLIEPADAEILQRGWTLLSRVRNAVTLVTGKPSDLAPAGATRSLAAVAHLLGYPPDEPASLLEDLLGRARRSRAVMERLFYDDAGGQP